MKGRIGGFPFGGLLAAPGMVRDDAEKMIGVGLAGVDVKDLPVQALRLIQAAGLVGFDRRF